MKLQTTIGYQAVCAFLQQNDFKPFPFQEKAWQEIIQNRSGLLNAPTGCGKTYAIFMGALIRFINQHPTSFTIQKNSGLQLLWVTPLKALAKDIARAMEEVIAGLNLQWKVAIRNGDTSTSERQKQKKQNPEVLIITPESLHLLLAQKDYASLFSTLQLITVDEWHELLGGKRGVQVELAISRIIGLRKKQQSDTKKKYGIPAIWGISATIGNLDIAKEVLLNGMDQKGLLLQSGIKKKIQVHSILPDTIEKYPWAGHLGLKLLEKVLPVIYESTTTLIFINTRGMTEIWYQALLLAAPELAGAIAIHHGSMQQSLRNWVEDALHTTKLKAVVCTASLDLGVDFRPVETVIQVGSPKGVARFIQRAGRSGHQPNAVSKIYFLPTHSLELMEAVALQESAKENNIENKEPLLLCYDVLIQYLCTLAISDGFDAEEIWKEVKNTYCFKEMDKEEFNSVLHYITKGGNALTAYDEFKKVEFIDEKYYIKNRKTAMQHRLHIGTIVSDTMLKVKLISGGYIGLIEEYFIARLLPGDVFTLAGKKLELIHIREMTVSVRKSNAKKAIVPNWMGGRMSFTANLGKKLRAVLGSIATSKAIEIKKLQPLFNLQNELSKVPGENELLIEHIQTKDGYHLFVYPFEGRLVHEAIATILAYRISKIIPITISIAMNDYGFELLSDQPIPVTKENVKELFTLDGLFTDMQKSVNSTEMAKRKFRDIAVIGGLIFQGFPGEQKKARHLQSSASLLYKVFCDYEPDNLLLKQAYTEVFQQQMEEQRLRDMLRRIQESTILMQYPETLTPFCFPIKVDSMREELSSENLLDRVLKMQKEAQSK